MYLKDYQLKRFPVGEGSVKLNYEATQKYNALLKSIGTGKDLSLTEKEIDNFNNSRAPSHTEMIAALAPGGNPDLIIWSYWMPDLDILGGDSPVSGVRAHYNVNARQTIALSENGPGAIVSALEYASRAMLKEDCNEVWLFFLNQFQGGSEHEEEIFWNEPGMAVWMRICKHPESGEQLPKITVNRDAENKRYGPSYSRSEVWRELASSLESLHGFDNKDIWTYQYDSEFNKLALKVHITPGQDFLSPR